MAHCMKNVRIRSLSGPYSVQVRENTNQKNSEYEHFYRSARFHINTGHGGNGYSCLIHLLNCSRN